MALNLESIGRNLEKLMKDTVRVRRISGESYDPVTMEYTPTYDEIYNGIGYVVPMGDPESTTLGGRDIKRIQFEIGLPRSAPEIKPNDVVDVLATADAVLLSTTDMIYVHDIVPTTFLTHRRVKGFRDVEAV